MFEYLGGTYNAPGVGAGKDTLDLVFGGSKGLGKKVQGYGSARIKEKEHSTYVIGRTGSGKSTVLLNNILESISQGEEAVIVIDPHGDLAQQVLLCVDPAYATRAVYFDPLVQRERPLGMNPFQWQSEVEYHKKSGTVAAIFAHAWYGSFRNTPTLQATLSVLVKTLFTAYPTYGCHFGHLSLVLREDKIGEIWRARLSELVQDDIALSAKWSEWRKYGQRKADTESTRGKVTFLLSNRVVRNILCQTKTSPALDFGRIFAERKVLVCSLYGLDEEDQRLLGGILLGQILTAAFLRADRTQRTPVCLVVDEFDLFPHQIFTSMLTKARKFGLRLVIANQNFSQIDRPAQQAALSAGNLIAMQTTPEDARVLQKHFDTSADFPEEGLHQMDRFQAVTKLSEGTGTEQAWIDTYPEQGREDQGVRNGIVARSAGYGRPRRQVEAALGELMELKRPTQVSEERRQSKHAPKKGKPTERPKVKLWGH
ncbi:MAG: type IV secretory system conjugative DNA transfer family protein [Anaerolineae bacterium]